MREITIGEWVEVRKKYHEPAREDEMCMGVEEIKLQEGPLLVG